MGDHLLPGERMPWSPSDWRVGDQVWWQHQPRGGYGFISKQPAEVIGHTAKRVRIRVPHAGGYHDVLVTPRMLELRQRSNDGRGT